LATQMAVPALLASRCLRGDEELLHDQLSMLPLEPEGFGVGPSRAISRHRLPSDGARGGEGCSVGEVDMLMRVLTLRVPQEHLED